MKRRWLRLLVAYLMGGYIASSLIVLKLPAGSVSTFFTIKWQSKLVLSSVLWPLECLLLIRNGAPLGAVVFTGLEFLVPCFICYRAFRHFVPKPLKYRFCPVCGHDLRSTPQPGGILPDRCPQCGNETPAAIKT